MKKSKIEAKDYLVTDYLESINMIIVPRYQRNYAWEKKNIKELMEDLIREDNYYIGNIIVNDLGDKKVEIIDGQQRIISIFLIYIALFHLKLITNMKYIVNENELKINIEKRIENSGTNVMKAIHDNKMPSSILKFNEVKRFNDIKKFLKDLNSKNVCLLIEHLENTKIVEIKFTDAESLSHEMFVNLNTKGRPLEGIEIIKSHLFKYLMNEIHSDFFKEEWYQMLEMIGEKYHGKYLQNIGLFQSCSRKKMTEKESLSYLIENIDNKEKAEQLFNFMTNKDLGLSLVYSAVKKHDLKLLKD